MTLGSNLPRLVRIMERLRADDGCPWDKAQTLATLRPFLIEETYEVLDAMEDDTPSEHCEELGDLLFQIIFQSQIRQERDEFNIEDVVNAISDKLERRHPHVFGGCTNLSREDIRENWTRMKAQERREKGQDQSAIAGIPRSLPGLLRADRLGRKASNVGFDWPTIEGVFEKIDEEMDEVKDAIATKNSDAVHHEVGDLLFAVVNLTRHLEVDPSAALQDANDRFDARFRTVEELAQADGLSMENASSDALEHLWEAAKDLLK